MLSRIAESLFWIGRHIERADGTARIVDVLRLQLLEDPGAKEKEVSRTTLASATRSSWVSGGAASIARRTTSQPRGAVNRSA